MTMVANKLTPFYPIHPGEILKDEVEYRKIEAALGLDPEMLLNMQTRYNMQVARADQRTQDRWNEVRKLCASFL